MKLVLILEKELVVKPVKKVNNTLPNFKRTRTNIITKKYIISLSNKRPMT